jgi:hypothetical protein
MITEGRLHELKLKGGLILICTYADSNIYTVNKEYPVMDSFAVVNNNGVHCNASQSKFKIKTDPATEGKLHELKLKLKEGMILICTHADSDTYTRNYFYQVVNSPFITDDLLGRQKDSASIFKIKTDSASILSKTETPMPPVKQPKQGVRMIDSSTAVRYQQYRDAGWSDQHLVDAGLAVRITEPNPDQSDLPNPKYLRRIYPFIEGDIHSVDIYRVLDAFETHSSELDHAVKKILCAGERGIKDKIQDLQEAISSIHQCINLINEKSK